MKDKIKRGIVIGIFGLFLVYLFVLMLKGESIVNPNYPRLNIPMYIILIVFCLYMIGLYGIYPIHIRFSRSTALVIGLLLIVLSKIYLENDGTKGIIVGDLFIVLGVLILILFPTNVLTTDKVKKAKAKKNEVIIEV